MISLLFIFATLEIFISKQNIELNFPQKTDIFFIVLLKDIVYDFADRNKEGINLKGGFHF